MTLDNMILYSFNTRGLANNKKRNEVFQWLKRYNDGIILFQETHTDSVSEKYWQREWDGEIIFAHGTNNSKGVAILLPKNTDYEVKSVVTDENGRYILLDISINDNQYIVLNVYLPTKDKPQDQRILSPS